MQGIEYYWSLPFQYRKLRLYLSFELKWHSGKGTYWQRKDTQGLNDAIWTENPDYFGHEESNKCLNVAFLKWSVKSNEDITS